MTEPRTVEEQFLRQQGMNMRLIVNRSHANMRFMDFRVGNYDKKREALDRHARREKLRKIFTLVEKQDSKNWNGVGFTREGVYPSFFRTADAYAMCRHYDDTGTPLPPVSTRGKQPPDPEYPAVSLGKPELVKVTEVKDEKRKTSLMNRLDGHLRALPFGRATSPDLVIRATFRKEEGWACAEINDSYGHAVIGFHPPPLGRRKQNPSAQALLGLLDSLDNGDVNNLFGLAPTNDEYSNGLYSQLDFRITGRLVNHLITPDGATTALVWHRRLGGK